MAYAPSVNAKSGRTAKLYVEPYDGSPTSFVVVSGIQDVSYNENNNPVDITNSESNGYQELGADFGTKVIQLQCSGIYNTNSTGFDIVREASYSREPIRAKFALTGYSTEYIGYFVVTEMPVTGNYNDAIKFSFTLSSTGPVTKVA